MDHDEDPREPGRQNDTGHRLPRLHRSQPGAAPAQGDEGRHGDQSGQHERLLRSCFEKISPGPDRRSRENIRGKACVYQGLHRRRGPGRGHIRSIQAGGRGQPGRTGRGALQHRKPPSLYRDQPGGLLQHPRSLPPSPGGPPGLRLLVIGIRGQPEGALQHRRQGGLSRQPVRGHEEGRRAAGPQLRQAVRHPLHRPSLLHRLRPRGTAGHVLLFRH